MNEIYMIMPRKVGSIWMFTDPVKELTDEIFVESASEIIDEIVKKYDVKDPEDGFLLLFSSSKFPESTALIHIEGDDGGNWYKYEDLDGWLCPALFKYFNEAPETIYIQAINMRKN